MPHRRIELMIYYFGAFDLHLLARRCRCVAIAIVCFVVGNSEVSIRVTNIDRRMVWKDLIINICSPQWDTDRFIRM